VDALVRRRAYEKTLFLKPVEGFAPAPSPVLPPKLDYDAGALTPSSTPQVLSARLEGDRAIADRSQRMLPLEDAGPSDSERAAAAVTSRLASLLPEADFAPVGPPVEDRPLTALSEPEPPEPEQRALEHRDEAPRTIDVQTADEPAAAAPMPEP